MNLTEEQAIEAMTILNEECAANIREPYCHGFVHYVTQPSGWLDKEWRFQGALGFGGKFRINSNRPHPYVDCYPEDETPKRLEMIARANARLEKLAPVASETSSDSQAAQSGEGVNPTLARALDGEGALQAATDFLAALNCSCPFEVEEVARLIDANPVELVSAWTRLAIATKNLTPSLAGLREAAEAVLALPHVLGYLAEFDMREKDGNSPKYASTVYAALREAVEGAVDHADDGKQTRTVHDPFIGADVQVSDRLVDRLRGKYASGPVMPNGEPEFGWRQFPTPPIQHEAAARIEELERAQRRASAVSEPVNPKAAVAAEREVDKP